MGKSTRMVTRRKAESLLREAISDIDKITNDELSYMLDALWHRTFENCMIVPIGSPDAEDLKNEY